MWLLEQRELRREGGSWRESSRLCRMFMWMEWKASKRVSMKGRKPGMSDSAGQMFGKSGSLRGPWSKVSFEGTRCQWWLCKELKSYVGFYLDVLT